MRRGKGVVWFVVAVLAAGAGSASCGGDPPRAQPSGSAVAAAPKQAEADYTALVGEGFDSFPGATKFDPGQGELRGPHAGYVFSAVATAAEITAQQAAALGFVKTDAKHGVRPADGHEFLILRTSETSNLAGQARPPTTNVTIRTGGTSRPLKELVTARRTLILSVVKGAEATLVLDDEGRTQTLDLRTGKRGPDAIALYYPTREADVDGDLGCWGVAGITAPSLVQGNLVSFAGGTGKAGLYPFYGRQGWAPPGRAWLTVGIKPLSTIGDPVVIVDPASFKLTPAGGKPVAPVAATGEIKVVYPAGGAGEPVSLVFDVPDTFRSGSITFAPQGTVTVMVNGSEKKVTFRPRTSAKPFTVQLPA
jgi:hypothetical protein